LVSDCIASGAPAPALATSTIETAAAVLAGTTLAAAASTTVAALTKGVFKSMLLNQCKTASMALVVALGVFVSGHVLVYHQAVVGQDEPPMAQGGKTEFPTEIPKGVQGRKKLPDWFQKLDADNDGQVSLYEWRAAGKSIAEFRKWDLNDDGFITPYEAEAVQRELNKLVGAWQVLSLVVDGQNLMPKDAAKNRSVVTRDDMLTVVGGEKETQAALKVNPSKYPQEIDISFTAGPAKGEIFSGLYKLEGDYLTICYSKGDSDRPTDFTSKPGSGKSLLVYKRQKP
jgi:uncharacterized protein (TIGR03067 family)